MRSIARPWIQGRKLFSDNLKVVVFFVESGYGFHGFLHNFVDLVNAFVVCFVI